MQQSSTTKPRPRIDSVNRGFWSLAKERRLSVQKCDACDHIHFPGSPVCPNCLSEDQSWTPVSGKGEVLSWVRFHRAYWDSFRAELPYVVALVRLSEGPLLMTNILNAPEAGPPIGASVEVVFEDVDEEISLPKFRILA